MAKIIKRTINGQEVPLRGQAITPNPVEKPRSPAAVAPPTIREMSQNFAGAMLRFAKSGFKTVDEDTAKARLAVCRQCDLWDENARKGLGKCNHGKCGCTLIKHYLASEKCPDGKWS